MKGALLLSLALVGCSSDDSAKVDGSSDASRDSSREDAASDVTVDTSGPDTKSPASVPKPTASFF